MCSLFSQYNIVCYLVIYNLQECNRDHTQPFWLGVKHLNPHTILPQFFRGEVGQRVAVIHLGLSLPLFTGEFPMRISTPLSFSLFAFLLVTSISDTLYTPGSWSRHHGFSSAVWVQLWWVHSGSLFPSMARSASPPLLVEDWKAVPLNATLMRDSA